jgi:hypothetical protein
MADTPRSLSDLQTILADNVTGEISPQDLRDFLVTVLGNQGGIYCAAGAVAQGSISTTPAKVTGFNTNAAAHGVTPDHTDDSIQVNTDGDYQVFFQCSFSGSANETFTFHARVNGVEKWPACVRKLGAGGDVGSCAFTGVLDGLSAGDKVTVYVEASAGGKSITPVEMQLIVKQAS